MCASDRLRLHPSRSILCAGKEAAGPDDENHEEGKMACQNLPLRIDTRADGLGQPKHDAAGERPPKTAETADDDSLESIEQARGPDGRIEIRAQSEIERCNRDHDKG